MDKPAKPDEDPVNESAEPRAPPEDLDMRAKLDVAVANLPLDKTPADMAPLPSLDEIAAALAPLQGDAKAAIGGLAGASRPQVAVRPDIGGADLGSLPALPGSKVTGQPALPGPAGIGAPSVAEPADVRRLSAPGLDAIEDIPPPLPSEPEISFAGVEYERRVHSLPVIGYFHSVEPIVERPGSPEEAYRALSRVDDILARLYARMGEPGDMRGQIEFCIAGEERIQDELIGRLSSLAA